jgi:D-lactate dehydrogenase (cytochrome)
MYPRDPTEKNASSTEIFQRMLPGIVFETYTGKKKYITLPKYHLPIIKNAAGCYNYSKADLIDVFIGSEGTLCVIIEAVLKLVPYFKEVFVGIIFFKKRNSAYEFVNKIKNVSKRQKKKTNRFNQCNVFGIF